MTRLAKLLARRAHVTAELATLDARIAREATDLAHVREGEPPATPRVSHRRRPGGANEAGSFSPSEPTPEANADPTPPGTAGAGVDSGGEVRVDEIAAAAARRALRRAGLVRVRP